MIKMVGFDMAKNAAKKLYEQTGIGPDDVDVVELHDCFTANELLTYEAIGLCKEGEAEKFIWEGDNTYGGKFVTNPSGGLLSKGHPLGATGLAQCTELVWHLRGTAGSSPGRGGEDRAAAQPRPGRRVRDDDVPPATVRPELDFSVPPCTGPAVQMAHEAAMVVGARPGGRVQ